MTRATVPDTEDIALESLEEHHIVKWVLSELDEMDPEDERFDAKVTVLMENVRHHVEEEEDEYFPKVRDELGRNALNDLGDAMAAAKKVAPTHPHPRSPDTPPGNLVVGTAAGVVDRVGDTVNGAAQGGVSALGDLIATILRRKKPTSSPRGSSTARSTARRCGPRRPRPPTRSSSDRQAATPRPRSGTTKRTTRSASGAPPRRPRPPSPGPRAPPPAPARARSAPHHRQAGRHHRQAQHRTARSGAKATATSARKAVKRTPTTAKRAATTTGRTARKAARSTKAATKRAARR